MQKGKLFVLDGLDGCGKSTQLQRVSEALEASGIPFKAISFPDYSNESSALINMYLNGDFSASPFGVSAYAASSFYAVDRFASFRLHWEADYLSGSTILAARYVSSNAIHQMAKLPDEQWDDYLDWLYDYEFTKLGLPVPDAVIFLDMPIEVSEQLLASRYNFDESKKDIHEADIDYMKRCRRSALYAAKKLGWIVVPCAVDGVPLSPDTIAEQLIAIVSGNGRSNL